MTFQEKTLFQKTYIITASIIISALACYPLFFNYKYNNNSKNWLNHDYGKNLLSSTEEYSVFMTEGGDNQVFSTLYFTYAEKLRQDLFPYDQKGNIFKRIYGDLRYISYEVLEERRQTVDQGLFTGQEPFYSEIRTSKPPYLVPYALGRPATYLTWKLQNPENLGNFYYKNYGQMYKVQEIRYALVDILETTKSISISKAKIMLNEILARDISTQEWNLWLDQLVKDGYVSVKNNTISFIKSYPKPFAKDPRESFLVRWENIENIEYYDYLSREIVTSFSYEQIMLLSDEIKELENLYNKESNPLTKKEIKNNIEIKWQQILKYIETAKKTGHDSASVLHNLGIFLLSTQNEFQFIDKNYTPEAIKLWESVTKNFKYSWSSYNILLWAYLQEALEYPEKSEVYLEKFNLQIENMTNAMMHWKSMKKNIYQAKPYKSIMHLVQIASNFSEFAGTKFLTRQAEVISMINGPADAIDVNKAQKYIENVIQQISLKYDAEKLQKIFETWRILWNKKKSDPGFFLWSIQIMHELSNTDYININFFSQILEDSARSMPEEILQQEIQNLVLLTKVSKKIGNKRLEKTFTDIFLKKAKENFTPKEFEQINRQFQQMIQN